jgi:hypothetical protein
LEQVRRFREGGEQIVGCGSVADAVRHRGNALNLLRSAERSAFLAGDLSDRARLERKWAGDLLGDGSLKRF